MAWEKGQSGNPAGRRVEQEDTSTVRELAREHTVAAIKTLVKALKAKGEKTRVAAAIALLDRGYGKPAQELQHTGAMTVLQGIVNKCQKT